MLLRFESFLLQNACNIPLKIFTAPSNHGIYDHLSSYNYSMNIYLQYGSHGYNWFIVNNDKNANDRPASKSDSSFTTEATGFDILEQPTQGILN